MKRVFGTLLGTGLIGLALLLPAAAAAASGATVLTGNLSGAAEVPSVSGSGTGSVLVVIDATNTKITYVVTYHKLSGAVAAAHIHLGIPTVSGPVILPLKPGPTAMVGTLTKANLTAAGGITTFAQAVAAIKAGHTYINLHTAAHPGGEVRAQLR